MTATENYDVVILGGGLAGLTLARQLMQRRPSIRLAVVEKQCFPVSEATHKVGESSVEIGAHYFAEELGLKKHITDEQLPKFGLRFFFKDSHQSLAEGTEVGGSTFFSAPSYQLDRGRFENHLAEQNLEAGATILAGARVRELHLDSSQQGAADTCHKVLVEQDGEELALQARWIVDASGRASFVKRKLGLEEELGHDINAIWFRLDVHVQIDSFCDCEQWQRLTGKVPRRWLSTNHLMGDGYWVWLIPLASGSTSIGIVADPRLHSLSELNSFDKAMSWLAYHEPECHQAIEPHRDQVQDFLAIKKMSRGTRQVYSVDRWALVGEAAAFLDPFYSPGSDFIAIGNTMVTKLVEEDLDGKSIAHLAPALQSIFLTLFQNNLLTYRDQYPLFGNPRIMALKFVWDYAVYWGFPALLYFRGKLTDVAFIQSLSKGIEEIRDMNQKMQDFFRKWHEVDPEVNAAAAFVDQSQIEVMTRLNAELMDELDDPALRQRFSENVSLLRDLMWEITSRIQQTQGEIDLEIQPRPGSTSHLGHVFDVLNV